MHGNLKQFGKRHRTTGNKCTCVYVRVVGGWWHVSTKATLSPYFSAEDRQISGTTFHSSEATPPLSTNVEPSRKGAHLLISIVSLYMHKNIIKM